ncbi:hypothetical protein SO802_013403 [Lithocarpus litseifolius]|uniref:KIB1-4 beta-propeller domain-containing protein n=1 Tax=Lithocarpus litseifolius TaxID=425828 RepID=A0AAW2D5H0_9ROSI
MKSITIKTCQLSDKSWQTHEFRIEELLGPIRDVVYIDGNFYCLFGTYTLATFNTTHKELCLITKLRPPEYHRYHLIPHLFVSHGKLFVAYYDHSDPFPVSNGDSIYIIKFNRSQRAWSCKQSLKNHSLFLSCNSFSIGAVGRARKLANKVFYNDKEFNGIPFFISMEDHYWTCDRKGFHSYEDE